MFLPQVTHSEKLGGDLPLVPELREWQNQDSNPGYMVSSSL